MRSTLARKGTSLKAKVQELERKLAESAPKTEVDALKARIKELEDQLAGSVPKAELDLAKARIKELETKLTTAPQAKPTAW